MKKIARAMALLLFLNTSVALAQQATAPPSSRGEALRLLSNELSGGALAGEPIKCSLPLVFAARQRLQSLPQSARAALASLALRPATDTSIVRNGHRIHFDTTGVNTPALLDRQGRPIPGTALAYAESVGTTLGVVVAFEAGQLGYPPPPQDGVLGGGPEPDVYIADLGNSYGETWPDVDVQQGGTTSSYMTIHKNFAFVTPDSNRGLRAMKVTVAHEYHHAIQLGNYGYWFNDAYFYEITSTWMEDVVYHGINDYLNYLFASFSHFRNPAVPFTSNELVTYSRGIWGKFVERTFGRAAMKRSWEYVRQFRPLQAIDAAFQEYGGSFRHAFYDWARWNYYTGRRSDTARSYLEGPIFPEIAQLPRDFVPPSTTLVGTLEPFGSRYHQVFVAHPGATDDTLTVLISNIDLASAEAGTGVPEDYECILADRQIDPSYVQAASGLFAKFTAADPSNWHIWFLQDSSASQPFGINALAQGTAFPNPFYPDGRSSVSIPVDGSSVITGTLQIYSSGMDLVYSSQEESRSIAGSRQVFLWNGTTNGGHIATSGVYVFVLSLPDDRMVTGKIALLRK